MLTFIVKLYDSSSGSQLHHHYHIQQPCRNSHHQQRQLCSSHNSPRLSRLCTYTPVERTQREHFSQETTILANCTRSTRVSVLGNVPLFKNCPPFFFIILVLMTSSSDVWGFPAVHSLDTTDGSHRFTREASTPPVNTSTTSTSNSTHPMASTNSSISSSNPNIPSQQQSANASKTNSPDTVHNDPATKAELISVLISTLEKLGVLQSTDSSCFRLDKITRKNLDMSPFPSSQTSSTSDSSLGVFLFFEELQIATVDNSPTSGFNDSTDNSKAGLHLSCENDPAFELEPPTELKPKAGAKEGRENVTAVVNEVGGEFPTEMGISRTHIVVISTCSAIIGMFFLAAAFLRIRNYIKRARLEQEMSNRPKFRSCSVALRGATQSMEQLRRDSMISKASHQRSDSTKGSNGSHTNGSSRENSSSSSPRHDPDTAPLLLLPRGAQVPDPSAPADGETPMRLADEEAAAARKKMISPTSTPKNDINANTTEQRNQVSPKTTLDGITSFNGVGLASARDASGNLRENGQSVKINIEGNLNPSFSSGSFVCNLLTGTEDEHVKKQLGTMNAINRNLTSTEKTPRHVSRQDSVDIDNEKMQLKSRNKGSRKMLGTKSVDRSSPQYSVRNKTEVDISFQTAVRQNSLPPRLPEETKSDRLGQQVKCVEPVAPNYHQTVDAETGITSGSSLEISYFGLSKSDVSLSSVTNQGNEFSGQTEYHHPGDGYAPFETSCDDAFSNSEYNNNMDVLGNVEVVNTNTMDHGNQNTRPAQNCHQEASTDPSRLQNDDTDQEIDKLACNVNNSDKKITVNSSGASPAHAKPSVLNHGTVPGDLAEGDFLELSSQTGNISDLPQSCDTFPSTHCSPERVGSCLPLSPHKSADLVQLSSHETASHDTASHNTGSHDTTTNNTAPYDTASHDTTSHDPASHDANFTQLEPQLKSEIYQSVDKLDNENATNKTCIPSDESESCRTQPRLRSNTHETTSLLPSSSSDLVLARCVPTDLLDETIPQLQNHVSSIEEQLPNPGHKHTQPNPDQTQRESNHSLSDVYQELDRQPGKHIDDFSLNDTSLLEANTRCCAGDTSSSDQERPQMGTSDLCHQLMPLQAHN